MKREIKIIIINIKERFVEFFFIAKMKRTRFRTAVKKMDSLASAKLLVGIAYKVNNKKTRTK